MRGFCVNYTHYKKKSPIISYFYYCQLGNIKAICKVRKFDYIFNLVKEKCEKNDKKKIKMDTDFFVSPRRPVLGLPGTFETEESSSNEIFFKILEKKIKNKK